MALPSKAPHLDVEPTWLSVAGEAAPDIARELSEAVEQKIAQGKYRREDVEYIGRIKRQLVDGTLDVSESKLEKLRRLCQLWEVDIKPSEISSHRPFIGPVIVAFKKLLFPILRVLLKDTLRQQRDFNSAAISLLTELCQKGKE